MSQTRKAIENLEKYTKELREADKALSKLKKGSKEYNAALKKHEQAYKKARASAQQLRGSMSNLSTTFKSHRDLIAKGGQAMSGFNSAASRATAGTKKMSGGLGGAIKTLTRFGLAFQVINLAVKAFKFFTTDAIKKGAEFEAAVANLSAVAGVGGEKLDQLKDAALAVAGETKFTANEIVELQTELSKLGFSADDVVAATSSIAFGAQALGENLGAVASQVGKVINQFNLLAEESSMVIDTIVTTINESALSMSSFGTAIQYVGPLASGLGLNLQETAGAMAILADNGFTASRVGTGLRGIFTELGTETIDIKGKLRELAKENLSLSEAVDLVGKRNAAQLVTLVDNIEALDKSEDSYYSKGRALESAAIQANTFKGNMDILKSAIDKFQISIGESILKTDFFRGLLAETAPEAGRVAAAFRTIQAIGAEGVSEDLRKIVVDGASIQELAIQRVVEATGKTTEQVRRALREQEGYLVTSYTQVGTAYERFEQQNNETGQAVQGMINKYKELAEQERKNIIVSQARNEVQAQYQDQLDDLIVREALDEDITADANSMAEYVKTAMKDMRDEIAFSEKLLEGDLSESQRKQEEDLVLSNKAKLKEYMNYYRLVANLIGIEVKQQEEAQDEISRRRARNFREEVDAAEDAKKALKATADAQMLVNEANENFTANTQRRVDLNKDLRAENNKLIADLKAKRGEIDANAKAQDRETKQGEYNWNLYQREIETLDKLIMKYENKNDALDTNAKTLQAAAGDVKKQLKVLEDEYADGNIGTKAFTEARAKLVQDYKDQLILLAGDDKELLAAAQALGNSFENNLEGPIDWREIIGDGLDEAIDTVSGIVDNFNATAFENLKNRLEAEKEALKGRYETEDYLAKQQFENGLINEAQYRRRQQVLRKKQIAEENAIDKKIFDAENKRDKNKARTDYLESLASIIPELIKSGKVIPTDLAVTSAITAALATASYTSELSAINSREFIPKKFAQGGIVNGPSHAQGGVPFTVQGKGGYEMEGGEFIVNKKASSLHRALLESINNSVKPATPSQPLKFAQGGVVSTVINNAATQTEESVNYLKAIAEATTSSAINSAKPVRAFVTSNDLRSDETARRIKDNNTIL